MTTLTESNGMQIEERQPSIWGTVFLAGLPHLLMGLLIGVGKLGIFDTYQVSQTGNAIIGIGLAYNLIATKITIDNQQRTFLDNAKENLGIMSAMQSIQNKQNSSIMSQLGRVARLPEPTQPAIGLEVDDIIFEEMEQ